MNNYFTNKLKHIIKHIKSANTACSIANKRIFVMDNM